MTPGVHRSTEFVLTWFQNNLDQLSSPGEKARPSFEKAAPLSLMLLLMNIDALL
jgi:hypothetical protein